MSQSDPPQPGRTQLLGMSQNQDGAPNSIEEIIKHLGNKFNKALLEMRRLHPDHPKALDNTIADVVDTRGVAQFDGPKIQAIEDTVPMMSEHLANLRADTTASRIHSIKSAVVLSQDDGKHSVTAPPLQGGFVRCPLPPRVFLQHGLCLRKHVQGENNDLEEMKPSIAELIKENNNKKNKNGPPSVGDGDGSYNPDDEDKQPEEPGSSEDETNAHKHKLRMGE